MNWTPSIRKAIFLPFFIIILVILLIVGIVLSNDYKWLLSEQGSRMLHTLSENTADRFNYFLEEPLQVNRLYTSELERMAYYTSGDLSEAQAFSLHLAKSIIESSPQISSIGYGDEAGNYLGIRMDGTTGKVNLMLKDSRTNGKLVIYEGEDTSSKVLASYDNYDPRTRPWYAPVKENPHPQWSDIYINYDEKMDVTVSLIRPLFDHTGAFRGTTVTDVKLDGMTRFLQDSSLHGSGTIYMMNASGEVLAHTDPDPIASVIPGNPPTGTLGRAVDSKNPLIRNSAAMLSEPGNEGIGLFSLSTDAGSAIGLKTALKTSLGLDWEIVTVLPERDLMGSVKSHQMASFTILALSILLLFAAGSAAVSITTTPIVKVTQAISALSQNQLGSTLAMPRKGLYETRALIEAFNKMTARMNASFVMLRDSEEKYRILVESSNDMIYSLDPEGRFLSVNSAFEESTGISRSEIQEKTIESVLSSPENVLKWKADFEKAINSQRTITGLTQIMRPDGRVRIFNTSLTPIHNEAGELIAVIGTNHDVSRILEIEADKISAMSYVVSGIAHEMNTPIGNCITSVTYFQSELTAFLKQNPTSPDDCEEVWELLDTAQESTDLIQRNLEKSRILIDKFKSLAAYQDKQEDTLVDLTALVQRVFDMQAADYPDKKVTLVLEPTQPITVSSREDKLEKVFIELFQNSFEHGFIVSDQGLITISLVGPTPGGELTVRYRDNGIGISKDVSRLVFTPFFSTKFGTQHSGLGLNIVYNIIKSACNGDVMINENCTEGLDLNMILRFS